MDWTKFYYANPSPERFVAEVKEAVARGIADTPGPKLAFATFLGFVMAANRARIAGWLDELSDLGAARELLQLAAWLSGTSEGEAWLRATGADAQMLEPAPDLLQAPLDGFVLDMLWSIYFATGDERPVRRIVSGLETNDAAAWSLRAVMAEHAPLMSMCERLFESAPVAPSERIHLALALQAVDPERWEVKIDEATGMATVNRRA